ncbi:hypothetical protein B0H10DRAFT_2167437 [Mycena sp. CBHHK59/15]|nr:hypothetical protein B0H10DRAFT_2167437 [Mycena sp. CBHHK59/15]
MFDLMMVSRSRTTRITHLYSKKKGHHLAGSKASTSQRYSQGNVAIFAQDVPTVLKLLPPDISDVQEAIDTIPNRKNIEKLGPILVSKNRIATIIDFLLTENSMYLDAGVEFNDSGFDVAVPRGIELCCLPDSDATDPSMSSYTDRGHAISADIPGPAPATYDALQVPRDQIVMEAVGYTVGDSTPQNYDEMKASALAWCLDKKKYISMRTGSKFTSDREPGLLTFTFPRLDPWGIGGFNEPLCEKSQIISFERQLKNLLRHHDGSFQNDPMFAYVCWNIIQKKEVNRHIKFRTNTTHQSRMIADVMEMAPLLSDLMAKWEKNDHAKVTTKAEKKAMSTLNKLKLVARDLRGTSGYKQSRRNEIRAMYKKMSTPALFITINPADTYDLLLGAMGGIEPDIWANMMYDERGIFVVRHPGPAAEYFDFVITHFIDVILKYNPKAKLNPDATDPGVALQHLLETPEER